MSPVDPVVPVSQVEDDPSKPWKAVAAFAAPAVLAAIDYLVKHDGIPPWVKLLAGAVAAGVATFVATNPKRRRQGKHEAGRMDTGLALLLAAVVILVVVVLVSRR